MKSKSVLKRLCTQDPVGMAEKMHKLEAELEEIKKERDHWKDLECEAANYVESVICLRTHFTGEPPYVGWKGLGLALNETLDELAEAKAELASETRWASEYATKLQASQAHVKMLRDALRLCLGAIQMMQPCVDPECKQTQTEWKDDAEKLAKEALAATVPKENKHE